MTLIFIFPKIQSYISNKVDLRMSHDQTAGAKTPLNWSRRSGNAQGVVCDFEKSRIFFRFFFSKFQNI